MTHAVRTGEKRRADLLVTTGCLDPIRVVAVDKQRDVFLTLMVGRVFDARERLGRGAQLVSKPRESSVLPD